MASIRRAFTDEFKAVRLVTVEGHSARQGTWASTSRCCGVGSGNWKHAKPAPQE